MRIMRGYGDASFPDLVWWLCVLFYTLIIPIVILYVILLGTSQQNPSSGGIFDDTLQLREPDSGLLAASDPQAEALPNPYQPLPSATHTRLVALEPGWAESEQLRATLIVVDLADNPSYEAISYAWGRPRFIDKNIYLNGHKILIRFNLWACLQRLPDDGRPRRLWIDALSIFQDDPGEKSQQVSLIGNVFHQAAHVRVWLGDHGHGSKSLFQSQSVSKPELMTEDKVLEPSRSGKQARNRLEQDIERRKQVWRHMMDRDYFKRRWIIQEILLAQEITVHCGDDAMRWDAWIQSKYSDLSTENTSRHAVDGIVFEESHGNPLFFRLLKLRGEKTSQVPLLEMMDMFADAECSNQHDRVYAFLAIDKPREQEKIIQPDYTLRIEDLLFMVLDKRFDSFRPRLSAHDRFRYIYAMFRLSSNEYAMVEHYLNNSRFATYMTTDERRSRSSTIYQNTVYTQV